MKVKADINFLAVIAIGTLVASTATATPRVLPFTYPYETLPEGSAEIEQFVDATWVRIPKAIGATDTTFAPAFVHTTEIEYGVTDRLEVASYLTWSQDASPTPAMTFEGTQARARYRVGDEGELPIDVAFYLEGALFHDEYELEEKVILSKRFGNLHVMANLWVEQEFARGQAGAVLIVNPTFGVTYQLAPQLHLGAEYWARGELAPDAAAGSVAQFNEQLHHFVGPAVSFTFGKLWWTVAAYSRVDRLSRASQLGDAYGKVWLRTAVGLEF